MKRLFLICTLVLLVAGASRADEGKPMTSQGNWGWIFSFSGLSDFHTDGMFSVGTSGLSSTLGQSFQPGPGITPLSQPSTAQTNVGAVPGIGMRYYLGNNMALRAGAGLGLISTTSKSTSLPDSTNSMTLIGIQAMLEWHMAGLGSISPYLAGGLGFTSVAISDKGYSTTTDFLETKKSGTLIEIMGAVGFEWFFANRMSLGGEYRLGVGLGSGSVTSNVTLGGTNTSTTSDLPSTTNVSTSAFSVMLSLYP